MPKLGDNVGLTRGQELPCLARADVLRHPGGERHERVNRAIDRVESLRTEHGAILLTDRLTQLANSRGDLRGHVVSSAENGPVRAMLSLAATSC